MSAFLFIVGLKMITYAFLFSADLSQVWPEANQHFSKEIDDEANSYFQRIYNHPPHPTMSVDEVSSYMTFFSANIIPLQIESFPHLSNNSYVMSLDSCRSWKCCKGLRILPSSGSERCSTACFETCLRNTDSSPSTQTRSCISLPVFLVE